jgi:hypothetical protein
VLLAKKGFEERCFFDRTLILGPRSYSIATAASEGLSLLSQKRYVVVSFSILRIIVVLSSSASFDMFAVKQAFDLFFHILYSQEVRLELLFAIRHA